MVHEYEFIGSCRKREAFIAFFALKTPYYLKNN